MPSQDDIRGQQELLAQHRQTLQVYLKQRATLGEAYAPPGIASGIHEARENISRIKTALREWGASVEDHPDDEEPPTIHATPSPPFKSSTRSNRIFVVFAGIGLVAFLTIALSLIALGRGASTSTLPTSSFPSPTLSLQPSTQTTPVGPQQLARVASRAFYFSKRMLLTLKE